ncbi:MAG: hypothetical protein R6W69_12670 [Anaerolineales bacterium]
MKTLPFLLLILSLMLAACQSAIVDAPEQKEEPALIASPEPGSDTEEATLLPNSPEEDDMSIGQPQKPDLSPRDGDSKSQSGNVYIEDYALTPFESDDPARREELGFDPAYPLQFLLYVSGNLPDPCHELRMKVDEPDKNGRVDVQLYSLRDPDMMCIQVLQPFDFEFPLQFPAGSYQLYLNGEKIAEFEG